MAPLPSPLAVDARSKLFTGRATSMELQSKLFTRGGFVRFLPSDPVTWKGGQSAKTDKYFGLSSLSILYYFLSLSLFFFLLFLLHFEVLNIYIFINKKKRKDISLLIFSLFMREGISIICY